VVNCKYVVRSKWGDEWFSKSWRVTSYRDQLHNPWDIPSKDTPGGSEQHGKSQSRVIKRVSGFQRSDEDMPVRKPNQHMFPRMPLILVDRQFVPEPVSHSRKRAKTVEWERPYRILSIWSRSDRVLDFMRSNHPSTAFLDAMRPFMLLYTDMLVKDGYY